MKTVVINQASARARAWRGGAALIAATILFGGAFTFLAATFDYPDVLARPAAEVLPALHRLGGTGRLVWFIYGFIPLLLLPAASGVAALADSRLRGAVRAVAMACTTAMMLGLLRWPTMHWRMAAAWGDASAPEQASMALRFDAANFWLGTVTGEFTGELLLNTFFLLSAIVLARHGRRWLLPVGMVASLIGWTAMCRNLTAVVGPIAELNNVILPLWMLTLGVVLVRS